MSQQFRAGDPVFWAALACGPAFWLLLWMAGIQIQPLGRIQSHLPQLFMVIFFYPIVEEIVFRGGVQGWCLEKWPVNSWYGLSLANILTSIVFTSLHFFYHAPLWAAAVFIPSLVFGYFRERHSSLITPILLHVFYNSGYALLFIRF